MAHLYFEKCHLLSRKEMKICLVASQNKNYFHEVNIFLLKILPVCFKAKYMINTINYLIESVQFSSVQSLSNVRLFETPWITARQASLSITISQSSLKLTSIESVMPSSHLILCRPLFLLPPIPPSIRVFSH